MSTSPRRRSASTRQLATMTDDPELAGLLALMLLHHARRSARTRPDGSLVTLAEQDRSRWDVALISEGVARLQSALARDQLGPYQAQAAIAALHADAQRVEETDWLQIVGWYDELLRLTDTPVVRLNRAVAVGEADGPRPGSRRWRRLPTTSRVAAPSPPTSTSATVTSAPRRACTPRPLATPRVCRNAPTRPVRPHASTNSCATPVVPPRLLPGNDTERVARTAGAFPSGLVTFVFTDIEASTQLLRRIGDRYPPLLQRHQEILRAAWTAWGGCEVKTDGDSFFVAFSDPTAAIEGCAQAQRDLTSEPWPADAVIRVRMGIHTGLASPHGDDYIALAVHQAARVVDAGHGGQIVVSAETAEQVSDASRRTLATLGRYRVRDFDDPVELFQVAAPDLPAEFPPLRVLPADRHNLVGATTTIVGRDDDLGALADLVAASRLVSVVGPGGLGKTRLVTEYGIRCATEWDHGVWFVDLAPLSDPALVARTVADAVAAPEQAERDAQATVLEHLRDRRAVGDHGQLRAPHRRRRPACRRAPARLSRRAGGGHQP